MRETSKVSEAMSLGLLALLLNPIVLLIVVILGVVVLIVSVALMVYYGLVTAIVLLVLTSIVLLVLHYSKAVDLTRQPLILMLPFVMGAFGYFAERIKLFQIQPLWTTASPSDSMGVSVLVLLILLFAGLILMRRRR